MPFKNAPDLIKLYIKSCIYGFVLSAVFVALLVWFDVMGLGGLLSRSDDAILAVVIMWVLNGIVFAGVQFAIAIMSMADKDDDDDQDGGLFAKVFLAEPVPVRIKHEERRAPHNRRY